MGGMLHEACSANSQLNCLIHVWLIRKEALDKKENVVRQLLDLYQ